MSRLSPTFLLNWIVTAVMAMLVWFFVPGKGVDRELLLLTAAGMVDEPIEIEGSGSHANPWQLSSYQEPFASVAVTGTVGLKDNLDEIFQSSPHSPIDIAVIFNNMRRLGTQQLACSVLLSWEDPDAIGLAAMESALSEFESVTLAAPVTRGAVSETMPPGFRRASIPIEQISGDVSALPVVNRISVPNLIHGGDNSMLGFEVIDSEPMTEKLPLMARWDDRVILSFPLVAILQRFDVPIEGIRVDVGSHLQATKEGARIPIDEFGRLDLKLDQQTETELLAEDLIDAEMGSPDLPHLGKVILCDFRSHADITSRDFNRAIIPGINKILSGGDRTEAKALKFSRISSVLEMSFLLIMALGLSVTSQLTRRTHSLVCLVAIPACLLGLWIGAQNGLWLPGVAMLATVITAWLSSFAWGQDRKRTTSMPRLDRLEFDAAATSSAKTQPAPDKPEEEQDYALAPKDAGIDSKHESD